MSEPVHDEGLYRHVPSLRGLVTYLVACTLRYVFYTPLDTLAGI